MGSANGSPKIYFLYKEKIMLSFDWTITFYGIAMLIFGLYVAGIGLWGFVKKRPLVFAARQMMWLFFMLYIPINIQIFSSFSWERGFSFLNLMLIFQLAMMSLMVYLFYRQFTGYMIFGVSEETFREALTLVLNQLNLPFEETIARVRLPGIGADLQASVVPWMGTAQIRIKQREHTSYTKKIAQAMDTYYRTHPVKVQKFAFGLYLALGILLVLFTGVFVPMMMEPLAGF